MCRIANKYSGFRFLRDLCDPDCRNCQRRYTIIVVGRLTCEGDNKVQSDQHETFHVVALPVLYQEVNEQYGDE